MIDISKKTIHSYINTILLIFAISLFILNFQVFDNFNKKLINLEIQLNKIEILEEENKKDLTGILAAVIVNRKSFEENFIILEEIIKKYEKRVKD